MPPFTRAEYLERIAKTKQRMAEAGIELLLVSDPCNMNYLTGYDATSYYVHQIVALALDAEEPVWIGRAMDVACARFTTFLAAGNMIGYPEHYIGTIERHPLAYVAGVLVERGWERARIGVEMDAHFFTARCYAELVQRLPRATWHDATLLVNRVRIVKSPAEIACMREAGLLVERAMLAAIEAIGAGVRQCDVAATIYQSAVSGTPAFGGDMPEGPWMPAGPRTSAPHLTWTDAPYRTGEATNLELNAVRHRYTTALARTVAVGEPAPGLAALAPVVVEGMNAALDRARAGVTCEEVEAAWRRVINAAGIEKASRIGYSIGIGYPGPSWNERTASFQPGDTTVLEPNMTFHMIPGIWMEDWGFEVSETFRVTADGPPEAFSNVPRQLFVR
ncbi:MAG: Xaa-Pro peptidase family protein [Thermomicrobiales bacterium]